MSGQDPVVTGTARRRRSPLPARQEDADLQRERAAMDKARQGVALVIEAMDEAPDEYRRGFALCLVLARLSEAARVDMTRAMLRAAAGVDMKAAPVPAFLQMSLAGIAPPDNLAAPPV